MRFLKHFGPTAGNMNAPSPSHSTLRKKSTCRSLRERSASWDAWGQPAHRISGTDTFQRVKSLLVFLERQYLWYGTTGGSRGVVWEERVVLWAVETRRPSSTWPRQVCPCMSMAKNIPVPPQSSAKSANYRRQHSQLSFYFLTLAREWSNKVSRCTCIMFLMGGTVSTSGHIYCEHTTGQVAKKTTATLSFAISGSPCWVLPPFSGRDVGREVASRALLLYNRKLACFICHWASGLKIYSMQGKTQPNNCSYKATGHFHVPNQTTASSVTELNFHL